jgi:hypothetical protein
MMKKTIKDRVKEWIGTDDPARLQKKVHHYIDKGNLVSVGRR